MMTQNMKDQPGIMANPMMTFVCGALVGAAVGTAVALLYAPASGRDTRDHITDKASEMKDSAVEWKDRTVEAVTDWKDKTLSSASESIDRAAETLKNAGDGVDPRHAKMGSRS